jgi:4-amino-4-deoxy-L-arabinose transferase-like glycosyltransferase
MLVAATAERSATWMRRASIPISNRRSLELAGAGVSLAVALALYTRYTIYGSLSRDEGVYSYGGQQMAHGTPPYASIFDPKGPMAPIISGIAAGLARVVGRDTLVAIRLVFFGCALLTVVAVYFLVLRLWRSVLGALAAAVVFASFDGFARDALAGPNAKTPAVLFAVGSMWLAAQRQWFWAGFAGTLAFLVWQPLAIYPLIVVVAAVICTPERRWRAGTIAVLGTALPLIATVSYFAAEGALGKFVESALVFPLEGIDRPNWTMRERSEQIVWVVHQYYAFSGVLFWIGLALLLVAAVVRSLRPDRQSREVVRDPLVLIVVVTLVAEAAYALADFQGYPDVYPFLPYAAMGIGAAVALVGERARRPGAARTLVALVLAASATLTALSWGWFTHASANDDRLRAQRATACALDRSILAGTTLYALGDPVPLVLTKRRNPDRFIQLDSGVAQWKVDHTEGGFAGWTTEIRTSGASVIVIGSWQGDWRRRMGEWLRAADYRRGYVGPWRVFMTPQAYAGVQRAGLAVTRFATDWPLTSDGQKFERPRCVG